MNATKFLSSNIGLRCKQSFLGVKGNQEVYTNNVNIQPENRELYRVIYKTLECVVSREAQF